MKLIGKRDTSDEKIEINEVLKEDWNRVLNHIANLFYEDSKIVVSAEDAELSFRFQHSIDEDFTIHTACDLTVDGQKYTSNYSIQYVTEGTEKEQGICMKRALSHVMLDVLEQFTGMIQQWGILTGVRPTKLYHNYRKQGKSDEEIYAILKKDFRISDSKIALMSEIVKRQLITIPDLDELGKEISVYIGVPFCPTKCAYCTFPAYAIQSNRKAGRVESFIDGLHIEIRAMGKWLKDNNMNITSVYWGGGTPTSIEADEMDALYKTMFEAFPNPEKIREITVEAGRPDTITPEKIEVLKNGESTESQ